MKYILDRAAFDKQLRAQGFPNVSRFADRIGVHRNTILGYFRGKPVFSSAFLKVAHALGRDPIELIVPVGDMAAILEHFEEVRPVIVALLRESPGITVVLLGSRAKGRAGTFSDWDLGVTRPATPIGGEEFLSLRRIADELIEDLVRNVDVINLDVAPDWFWEGLDYEPVFLDGNREGYLFLKGMLHGIKKNRQVA
jgi:predicted nucleotidyltransferase